VAEVAGALVAWASIQASTAEYTEQLWVDHVEEVGVDWAEVKENEAKAEADAAAPVRPKSDVVVTSDTILPDEGGEIWTADIGHESNPTSASVSGHETPEVQNEPANPYTDLFTTLRRLSKIVLGGYGGAGLIFFGVPLPPPRGPAAGEKRILEDAVNASEADPSSAEPDPNNEIPPTEASKTKDEALKFGWWDLVRGKHDQELFEHYAFSADPGAKDKDKTGAANVSTDERLPRYWILNDHSRKQVVLVLRGSFVRPS
jgi:sn1-specific diacylglycerol lipase